MGLQINIDNGGTLTDICIIQDGSVSKTKVLTTPYDLSKCFFDGLTKASGVIYGEQNVARLLEEVDLIRYSTTQGTNAICERKGSRLGLIYCGPANDLAVRLAEQDEDLYAALVGDRVVHLEPDAMQRDDAQMVAVKAINKLTAAGANRLVVSFDGKTFVDGENLFRKIALRKYPRHLLGAVPILYGSDLGSDSDVVRRTWTALINSFLHPAMEAFLFNAENRLREYRTKNPLLIFRNDGDSSRVAKTVAIKTYSSGPRGGMEGMKSFSRLYGFSDVVAIDIGGTTTDIGQYVNGTVAEQRRGHVEGISVSFPLCEVMSAGVGGSSIFKAHEGRIVIGPESVGAVPGPASFGRGGKEATITDASLLCGILDPKSYFGGDLALDAERAAAAVNLNIAQPLGLGLDDALLHMQHAYEEKVAIELHRFTKVSPDTKLLAFGGAGPLNACGIAEKAGISSVAVPKMAAVFSAYGIGECDISHHYAVTLHDCDNKALREALAALKTKASRDMFAEGFAEGSYDIRARLVVLVDGKEVGYDLADSAVVPDALKGTSLMELELSAVKALRTENQKQATFVAGKKANPDGTRTLLTKGKGRVDVPVFKLSSMATGDTGVGPAIIEEDFFTCRVLDGWSFVISDAGDILLNKKG
ncbi:hydantoinase/oxoprolinase family protein [Dechloromonas sp. HYN0024]|uniref:hydantoinase/oxoprolinase family protein n=1 Tax=Dechloromonas sp. HYN0024 TaxID=2231055 RepID=UPI000E44BF36|nr:hydantoinase/oxoprolinase family protein [Dechloromonas sp. HYN0024]AXS79093.1 hydantoinase/oxoprolinase family protein [Dechloromonas sp. HYN0024]